jgi:hypothetical protein
MRNVKKTALILYDAEYEWWKPRMSNCPEFKRHYEYVQWKTYEGFIPPNIDKINLLVYVPHHSDGYECHFSNYRIQKIQNIVNEAVKKGWNRLHLHSCYTSKCFRDLTFNTGIKILLTGFQNSISADVNQISSTADTYLKHGCPQKSSDRRFLSLVWTCKVGNTKKVYRLIKIKK